MGLSSNQARFLSLTSRQIDMEQRIQQICQRRLRLSSELENVATAYNNSISNRKMFTASQTNGGIQSLTLSSLEALGYKVLGLNTNKVEQRPAINPAGKTVINSQEQFLTIVSQMNSGSGLGSNYVLNCDLDLSKLGTLSSSLINGVFTGTFDGNGHKISGLNINRSSAITNVGFFSQIGAGANVKNIDLEEVNIKTLNGTGVGGLAGIVAAGGTVANCYVSGNIQGQAEIGGLVGVNSGSISDSTTDVNISGANSFGECDYGGFVGANSGGTITNSNSLGSVSASIGTFNVAGFAGVSWNGSIDSCSSSGDVSAVNTGAVGGFVGTASGGASISNSYVTGGVAGSYSVGGFVGHFYESGSKITNSYAANSNVSALTSAGGFILDKDGLASSNNTNFYKNELSYSAGSEINGNAAALPTGSWDNTIWDKSTTLPSLKNCGYTAYADDLETGLCNGTYSLAKAADEFTQDPLSIEGQKYEEVDWRTTPEIYDELYKGDDATAEDKYDKTIDEINSQDKKLQLEQTSIETEYKAVTSEKDAVKKILDTNATSSFKYFS